MGGPGSGRWQVGKFTTDDFAREDVLRVWRYYELIPVDEVFTLTFNIAPLDMKPLRIETRVELEWTPCHFGGFRPWFICPCCRRRSRILYARPTYACRVCWDLAYEVCREDATERSLRKANKKLRRLGALVEGVWERSGRPKGMHWTTYQGLVGDVGAALERALPGLRARRQAELKRRAKYWAFLTEIEDSLCAREYPTGLPDRS